MPQCRRLLEREREALVAFYRIKAACLRQARHLTCSIGSADIRYAAFISQPVGLSMRSVSSASAKVRYAGKPPDSQRP